MNDIDPTIGQLLSAAARDESLPDDSFVMIRRAFAGVDVLTGEPVKELPKRMDRRGWRKRATERVEVGRADGWYWRCPRKTCSAWGGPFHSENEAHGAGRAAHHDAHTAGGR